MTDADLVRTIIAANVTFFLVLAMWLWLNRPKLPFHGQHDRFILRHFQWIAPPQYAARAGEANKQAVPVPADMSVGGK